MIQDKLSFQQTDYDGDSGFTAHSTPGYVPGSQDPLYYRWER